MSGQYSRVENFLNQRGVAYETIRHHRDQTAKQAAIDTDTPLDSFVKSVLLAVDGRLMLAVVPSDQNVDLVKVARVFNAREVELADEEDVADFSEGGEIGAAPPLGNLYGLPILMQADLGRRNQITFNGGFHNKAIRMDAVDFMRLALPRMADIAV